MLDEYKEHYDRWNKADIKDNILCDFVSVKFYKRQNYNGGRSMFAQVCGWKKELAIKGHEKAFQNIGNVLYFVCGGGYMTVYFVKNQWKFIPQKL